MFLYKSEFLSVLLIICFLITFNRCSESTEDLTKKDFYELLGISKTANNREIRKAFKELAVKLHPDKNPDDLQADDKFILLTRAYETLKDPEARKLYDLYGDAKSIDGNQKQKYQSYKYYQEEFGIYDNDPLIVTFSAYDFETTLNDPNTAWFVNFYSPQCWQCHELADTWRKLSKDLEGVVRIGAVNCQEDWNLCVQMGVRQFPQLVFFNKGAHLYEGQVYYGENTFEKLQDFVLSNLNLKVEKINVEKWVNSKYNQLEWVLFLCGDSEGICPEYESILKISGILDGLIRVGIVKDKEICKEINENYLEKPAVFYQLIDEIDNFNDNSLMDKKIPKKAQIHILDGLESQELAKQILDHLPDLKSLSQDEFNDIRERLRLTTNDPLDAEQPWLICFYLGSVTELNVKFKHIPATLPNINIGKVQCARNVQLCESLHISRYPTWAILKSGGAFEVHHGKDSLHEIASFARDSSLATNLQALSPTDFKKIMNEGGFWFIDWYAPWCPPCQRLMPELRRASMHFDSEKVQFGTIDCTLHSAFCSQNGIRAYPTTLFYNGSKTSNFQGVLNEEGIVDFVTDMINPIIIEITPDDFREKIGKKPSNELWIVNFYANWCGPCQKFNPEYRSLARLLTHVDGLKFAEVDCVVHSEYCVEQDIRVFPTIRLYPFGSEGMNTIAPYNGILEAFSFKMWVMGFLHTPLIELTTREFHKHVIAPHTPEKPWVIFFYTTWCSPCQYLDPEFRIASQKLEGLVRFAKINCDTNMNLCRSSNILEYPTITMYVSSEIRYLIEGDKSDIIIEKVKSAVEVHKYDEKPKNLLLHDEF